MIELLRQNIRVVAIIAVVVVLLIVNVMFYLQWQSVEDDQAELEKDWKSADTNLRVTRALYDLDTLQAEKDRLAAKPQFPSELPIVDLMLHVAKGAPLFDVSITEVTRVDTDKTRLTVTGTLTKIISFLKYIEGGPFNSIEIEDVSLSDLGQDWEGKFTIVVITQ